MLEGVTAMQSYLILKVSIVKVVWFFCTQLPFSSDPCKFTFWAFAGLVIAFYFCVASYTTYVQVHVVRQRHASHLLATIQTSEVLYSRNLPGGA